MEPEAGYAEVGPGYPRAVRRDDGGEPVKASRLYEALDRLDKHLMRLDEEQMALASDLAAITRERTEKAAPGGEAGRIRDTSAPPDAAPVLRRLHDLADRAAVIGDRLGACRAQLDL